MAVATIIGGSGRMGAWFAEFLAANGYNIIVCDRKKTQRCALRNRRFKNERNPVKATHGSEVVVFATPTHVTKALLEKVAASVPRKTLLVEISSIKEPVRAAIQSLKRQGANILSIHPMFGPGIASVAGKPVIVVDEPADSRASRRFLKAFRRQGAELIRSDLKTHDKIVATTLGLPHLMNIAYIETLREAGLQLNATRQIGGTTSRLQLIIAEALYHENLPNEVAILVNKHCARVFGRFVRQLSQIRKNAHQGHVDVLMKRLEKDRRYLRRDPVFRIAYEKFAAAAEAAIPF